MRALAVAAAVLVFAACDDTEGMGPSEPPDEVAIATTSANRFSPASAELAVGGVATWSFNAVGHTVEFDNVAGRPANIPLTFSANVARAFSTPGTYTYHCTIHTSPPMTGTIIVR